MPKLTVLVGLPASGKSTLAQELIKKNGNTIRINRDLLREMLHFNKWNGRNEGLTIDAEVALAKYFLMHNTNVIIDDTNLNHKNIQSYKDLADFSKAGMEVIRLNTSWAECVDRDRLREKHVGEHVIIQMAMQHGLYPQPSQGFILCDIDGTIADTTHRLHYVKVEEGQKKDWKGFFSQMSKDQPRKDVIDTLMKYESMGHTIIFVSARPDTYREITEEWLERTFNGYKPHLTLFMRKVSDKRDDTIVKQEIYNRYFKDKYEIYRVIDDRPSVIRMWMSNGLTVLDVGKGIEF